MPIHLGVEAVLMMQAKDLCWDLDLCYDLDLDLDHDYSLLAAADTAPGVGN